MVTREHGVGSVKRSIVSSKHDASKFRSTYIGSASAWTSAEEADAQLFLHPSARLGSLEKG